MKQIINPIDGKLLSDNFNKVLTFGLTNSEIAVFSKSIPKGTPILSCDNEFEKILTTPCNCIVFAPSKMNAIQKSQFNEIYANEERILMLSVENNKSKFKVPIHTINLMKSIRYNKKLYSFLESAQTLCFSNCDGYMLNDGFVLVDIETTGLDKESSELILVSAVRVSNMKIVDTFERLIKSINPIPKEIEKLCGITNEMVFTAESAETIVAKLINFIGLDVIVTYNSMFIDGFLQPVFQKLGYVVNTKPRLHLLNLVKKIYGNRLFSISSKVEKCASTIGIETTEIPCKFYEAEILTNVLLRLRNEYEIRAVSELEKLY